MYQLDLIEAAGTPTELGHAHGEALRDPIQAFVAQRLRAARVYLYERGQRDLDRLLSAGAACLDRTAAWNPDAIAEHDGICAAAGVDRVELFTTANMTDVRDVLLYHPQQQAGDVNNNSLPADHEGCTALALPPHLTASNQVIAAQTWDLNPGDLDYVVAIHRRPNNGPETWSVTCSGCLTLVGMNADGLWVGTTNIKTTDAQPGVPYLPLLHRAISAPSRDAAVEAIATAPRAGAHTYWIADDTGASQLECSATTHHQRDLTDTAIIHTNHCIDACTVSRQSEEPGSSSLARHARATAAAAAGQHTVETIKQLFADRSDGVDSINRYPEDQQGTATNACLISIPAQRELWACRGPSDRGEWQQLRFSG